MYTIVNCTNQSHRYASMTAAQFADMRRRACDESHGTDDFGALHTILYVRWSRESFVPNGRKVIHEGIAEFDIVETDQNHLPIPGKIF